MIVSQAIVDVDGLELTAEDKEFLSHPAVAGVILFTRNYESCEQLRALTHAIHQLNPNLMITVDQEGGRVQRFREQFTPLQPMSYFGGLYLEDSQATIAALQLQLQTMITELQAAGITSTLMPVVDLDYGRSGIIGERSLGSDPHVVTQLADVIISTLHQSAMPTTLKHFPGHGFVTADSHHDLPIDERSLEVLMDSDLMPFRRLLNKADYIMPAHIVFPQVDHRLVGFSPVWLQTILRDQLGFKGKIITDDLSMRGAAEYGGYQARAQAAIDAGCDYLLVCNNRDGAIQVVQTLEKRISTWPTQHSLLKDKSL